MKRKQLTLLVLLLVGVALLLTRDRWLPPLLSQIPLIRREADVIQALEALVSLVMVGANLLLAYLLWLFRSEQRDERQEEIEPLEPATPESIRDRLGQSGRVDWIDRGATRAGDLRSQGRLIITGRSGLGKTREAAELVRRAVAEDVVAKDRIYRPGPALRFLSDESLRQSLRQRLDREIPALLFVDDLPYHLYDSGLERLAEVVTALQECKAAYVVATARSDQLTDAHGSWLSKHQFHIVELPALGEQQSGRLVDSAAGLFDLQVDDEARAEFVTAGRGVPELTLIGLRQLAANRVDRVDRNMAQRVTRESLADAWGATRRYIVERVPAADPLLAALATFHAAGVDTYTSIVLHYALHRWPQARPWHQPWRRMSTVRAALAYLAHFDVVVQGEQIAYRDTLLEGVIAPEAARAQIGTFLVRHRRLFHRRWLRRLYREASEHRWALFGLAVGFQERHEDDAAMHFYSAAIRVSPHSGLYNNRGTVHANQGDLAAAIADYDQAIALKPDYATAFYNRGLAHSKQGELAAAIADYDQAIKLDPTQAVTFNNRGLAHYKQGELAAAIADYDQAITLKPDYATAFNNRGNAHYKQGELAAAIADYDQAITLDPTQAVTFYNRGNAHSDQGDLAAAITDYNQTIALDPTNAAVYSKLGATLRMQTNWVDAKIAHSRAVEINPRRAMDWVALADLARRDGDEAGWRDALARARSLLDNADRYNAACLESVAGNVETALQLLQEAIEQGRADRCWARRDPDLEWLHDDPRFWALVGDQEG